MGDDLRSKYSLTLTAVRKKRNGRGRRNTAPLFWPQAKAGAAVSSSANSMAVNRFQ